VTTFHRGVYRVVHCTSGDKDAIKLYRSDHDCPNENIDFIRSYTVEQFEDEFNLVAPEVGECKTVRRFLSEKYYRYQ
jgi:hypothetical protein